MDALGIADGSKVADLGAGGGWFTVRLARRVGPNGVVYAEDVQPQMIEAIAARGRRGNVSRNIEYDPGDGHRPDAPGRRSTPSSSSTPTARLPATRCCSSRTCARALKEGGRVGIVDYKRQGGGPGPDGARPDPASDRGSGTSRRGCACVARETFLPFQFFLVFERQG